MNNLHYHVQHPDRNAGISLNNILLSMCLMAVSFRILAVAAVLLILCSVINFINLKIQVRTFSFLLTIIAFFIGYFIFGLDNYERGSEKFINATLLLFFSCTLFFMIGFKESKKKQEKWLSFFSLCSIFYVIIVCVYSKVNGYQGYNQVYDPINGSEENSPLYALQLVLFAITYINFHWKRICLLRNTLLTIITLYFSVIYLGSRASFIILILFFIFKVFLVKKNIPVLILLLILITPVAFAFINGLNLIQFATFGGFADRGFDSPRFSMFIYGISNFLNYPTGGMKVQAQGYTGIWFHNMLLDIVRVAGYYIMMLWAYILLKSGFWLRKYSKSDYFLIFLIVNIALMQDLAFDGFFNIMALEFYLLGVASSMNESKLLISNSENIND